MTNDKILWDAKISYSIPEAAAATGLGETSIKVAIRSNDLVARYYNSKPLIERQELIDWIHSLPDERPRR